MLEQMNINLKTYKKPKSEKRFYDEENKVNHPLNFPIYNKGSVETFPLKQSSALSFKDTTDSSIRFISNRKERCLTDSNNILSNIKDFVENQTKNIHFENPNFNLIKISNDNISHSSKHSRNISKEIRMKSAYLNPCSENILILKNAFEKIPNFEEWKKSLNKKKDELLLNIHTLQKKIVQLKDELERNINNNTNLNDENINYCFKSEEIRHKQYHFDKDIPNLKLEIDTLKRNLFKITEENNKLNLFMYKLTTENNLECEDLTKINIEVKRKKEENKYLMNQLIKNKEINKNLKLEINNLKHNNNIVMNSLNNIL